MGVMIPTHLLNESLKEIVLGFYDGYVRDLDINTRKTYLEHQIQGARRSFSTGFFTGKKISYNVCL